VYFTDRVIGRTADYTLHIPLDDALGRRLTINYVGRTESPTGDATSGSSYDFTWDGNDANGNPYPGGAAVSITIGTFQPGFTAVICSVLEDGSQVCTYWSSPGSVLDIPIVYFRVVGSYKAIVAGLGGWTISAHHFYDAVKQMLYFGDGSSRSVRAQLVQNDTRYMAASEDGSEVYLFDVSGTHLQTLHGRTGAVLYQFAYDAQNQLQSITDAYGNKTRIQRDGSGNLTGIRAPFGQVTQLTLGADHARRRRLPRRDRKSQWRHPLHDLLRRRPAAHVYHAARAGEHLHL
jgi:YD repeat-containing protein